MSGAVTLFRIHIKPDGGTSDLRLTFDYCLREKILGVGWRTGKGVSTNTNSWDDYARQASALRHKLSQCQYIYKHVRPEDLV